MRTFALDERRDDGWRSWRPRPPGTDDPNLWNQRWMLLRGVEMSLSVLKSVHQPQPQISFMCSTGLAGVWGGFEWARTE